MTIEELQEIWNNRMDLDLSSNICFELKEGSVAIEFDKILGFRLYDPFHQVEQEQEQYINSDGWTCFDKDI